MRPPDYVILLEGKQYVTTTTAALMMGVTRHRIDQFLQDEALTFRRLPRSATRIIPLKEFRAFARKPRASGRPPSKKKATKPRKKS